MKTAVVASASAPRDKDISKALKLLHDTILPEDPEQVFRDTMRKQASLAKEKESHFIAEYSDGMIVLKRSRNA